jgi:hypothetical protein
MGMDRFGQVMIPEQIRGWTLAGIKAGIILDNNLPTDGSNGNWWRVFVKDSPGLIKLVYGYHAKEVARTMPGQKMPPAWDYIEIEWETDTGSHFGIGTMESGQLVTVYDPWPTLKRQGIKTLRFWLF